MALTGKTISQLTNYTSSFTGNELFPLEYNGATYHLSQSQFSASYAPNIYNNNGTLTGNRIISTIDKRLIFTGQNSLTSYTFNFLGTKPANSYPVKFAIDIEHTLSSSISPPTTFTLATSVYSTGANANIWQTENYLNWAGASGYTGTLNGHYLSVTRGSNLDVTTTSNNAIYGFTNQVGHNIISTQNSTTASITSSFVAGYRSFVDNYVGSITNAYNYYAETRISNSTVSNNTRNSNITNLYNIYIDNKIGGNYATATITNLYALYINSTVGATGTITNRWGIYALDSAMNHYINGNLLIGTNSIYSSAQVAIDSTTKGFLPPRMTNTQRTNISSPAVGLIVYCTDATEGLYVYKSTGWAFIV